MRLLKLKFGSVFAGDDALVVVDELGKTVEQRRLAGTGAAGHQRVDAATADDLEDLCAFRRNRVVFDELAERQLILLELTNGECGPVNRQRRNDDVDTRTIRQTRVADR